MAEGTSTPDVSTENGAKFGKQIFELFFRPDVNSEGIGQITYVCNMCYVLHKRYAGMKLFIIILKKS